MGNDNREIEQLGQAAAWRWRLVDANPSDSASAAAAVLLDRLADDLARNDYALLWTELRSIENWLGESGVIDDYANLAAQHRSRIGFGSAPADGAAYLASLLAIARGLV